MSQAKSRRHIRQHQKNIEVFEQARSTPGRILLELEVRRLHAGTVNLQCSFCTVFWPSLLTKGWRRGGVGCVRRHAPWQAFATIKSTTGISDIEEIATHLHLESSIKAQCCQCPGEDLCCLGATQLQLADVCKKLSNFPGILSTLCCLHHLCLQAGEESDMKTSNHKILANFLAPVCALALRSMR